MGKVLGIIGGGQLGMMLTEAAKKMPDHISKIIVLDPTENCPASQVGAEQIIADFKNEEAIKELAEKSDVLTYEIESGNSSVLKSLEAKVEINPSPETLRIIQDKLLQKSFLKENNLPVAEFIEVRSIDDLKKGLEVFGFPVLLKARKDAYDGRGNYRIDSINQIHDAYNYFKDKELMLEKFIPFKMEVSVIAARNTKGDIANFPLVENIHEENILRTTIAPARVTEDVAKKAQDIAQKTMTVLNGAGVFGIEMFVTKDDQILINEIAPRVHNSGHHTLQSSKTSQFEQHLRAILGLELGSTELLYPTIMYNILGSKEFEGEYGDLELDEKNLYLKMYQKKISKPLRKIGHFNLVGKNKESIEDLVAKLDTIKPRAAVRKREST